MLWPLLLSVQASEAEAPKLRAVALMIEQAQHVPPAALGDLLLAGSHPVIADAIVHPRGMDPSSPWITEIELLSQANTDDRTGFCSALHYRVQFEPKLRQETGPVVPSPARPTSAKVETVYRLPGDSPSHPADCSAQFWHFFDASGDEQTQKFAIARLLWSAKQLFEQHRRLPFKLSVHDRVGRGLDRLWSGRDALAKLPLGSISDIDLTPDEDRLFLPRRARVDVAGRPLNVVQVFAQPDWNVDLILANGRITRMYVVREDPPPF